MLKPSAPAARVPARSRRSSALLSFALCASLAGCLSEPGPGSAGPEGPDGNGIVPVDDPLPSDDFLTGTSSSTSWPAESGCNDNTFIMQLEDSALSLAFIAIDKSDGAAIPAATSGTATLYLGGVIPVLQRVPSFTWEFQEEDTLRVPLDSLAALHGGDAPDTVAFSIRLETVRQGIKEQAILIGYLYSFPERRFLRSPKTLFPKVAYFFKNPAYSLQGIGEHLAGVLPPVKGKPRFYFYIPGTEYYWERNLADTIRLGPLPENNGYPLRLLRITEGEGPQGETLLELFDVSFGSESRYSAEKGHHSVLTSKVNRPLWNGMKPSPLVPRDSLQTAYTGVTLCTGD